MFGRSTLAPSDFPGPDEDLRAGETERTLVLAGGCFWCTEAVYRELAGVISVVSGYAGGTPETANYKDVCSGKTDHAEAIEIRYDPVRASFGELLRIFFSVAHDPTQLNRQGNDVGRQYRSVIFYRDENEKRIARDYIAKLDKAKVFDSPIVTTLEPLTKFYPAEDYHQDYARLNPGQPYIAYVSAPKVAKLRKYFPERLKK
ncbi:MAG: peptide-methionine (S)-S-oxide reductase MsrA [Acidimicrobiia bacterium]|nr:peptide-methionine (S)-S-oxide reductase MsrA [Acidimicrobiia bacterium]